MRCSTQGVFCPSLYYKNSFGSTLVWIMIINMWSHELDILELASNFFGFRVERHWQFIKPSPLTSRFPSRAFIQKPQNSLFNAVRRTLINYEALSLLYFYCRSPHFRPCSTQCELRPEIRRSQPIPNICRMFGRTKRPYNSWLHYLRIFTQLSSHRWRPCSYGLQFPRLWYLLGTHIRERSRGLDIYRYIGNRCCYSQLQHRFGGNE